MNIRTVLHCDEIWSYGLANSYDRAFLCTGGNWADKNNDFYNRWSDGSTYFNYITVQPKETFAFNSVYRNQTEDVHPPLHYFILHLVCSFFPNKFSPWFGQIINIFIFILTQICLFKLALLLFSNSSRYALLAVVFYGFSMSAINTFLYIRMYALLTLFAVLLTYLTLKICDDQRLGVLRSIGLFSVGFLGFLTHHYFAFYIFAATLSFSLFSIIKKEYPLLCKYVFTNIASFAISFAYFPYIFQHSGSMSKWTTSRGMLGNFPLNEVFASLSCLINYIIGIELEELILFFTYLASFIESLAVFITPAFALLGILALFFWYMKENKVNASILLFLEFLIIIITTSSYTVLRAHFARYYFALFPFACFLIFKTLKTLLYALKTTQTKKDIVLFSLVVAFILASHYNSIGEFCFTSLPRREEISQRFKDASIIAVHRRNWEYFIHAKARDFMYTKRVFPCREYELEFIDKAVRDIRKEDKNLIIIPDNDCGKIILNMLKKIGAKLNYLFTDVHPNYHTSLVFEICSLESGL